MRLTMKRGCLLEHSVTAFHKVRMPSQAVNNCSQCHSFFTNDSFKISRLRFFEWAAVNSYIVLTRVEVTGEKVQLHTIIFAIDGRHEERFKRRKTLSAKNWQVKSRRWHEEVVREVKEIAAERLEILRG